MKSIFEVNFKLMWAKILTLSPRVRISRYFILFFFTPKSFFFSHLFAVTDFAALACFTTSVLYRLAFPLTPF